MKGAMATSRRKRGNAKSPTLAIRPKGREVIHKKTSKLQHQKISGRKRPASSILDNSGNNAFKPMRLGKPLSTYTKKVSLEALEQESARVGFDAQSYIENGFAVLDNCFTDDELKPAFRAAQRVRASKGANSSNAEGEFVALRGDSTPDRLLLFSLINKCVPFLHQLLGGIRLPGSDKGPYSHHNQIQVALKKPGFGGYAQLTKMSNASVGHVDQSASRQQDGRSATNYSVLLGIVLSGETGDRTDAGNLYVAPKSHSLLAAAFKERHATGPVPWNKKIAYHYLADKAPKMKALHAKPGQCILMHHQMIHGVGPNRSGSERVNVYFRVTAKNRPNGQLVSYPDAMRNPMLETPLLRELAKRQRMR